MMEIVHWNAPNALRNVFHQCARHSIGHIINKFMLACKSVCVIP